MAGLEILVLVIWVRILVPQPDPRGFHDVLSWSYCLNRKKSKKYVQ